MSKSESRATPPVSQKPTNIPRGAWEDQRYQSDMEWSRSYSTGVLLLFNGNNRCSYLSPRSISGRASPGIWKSLAAPDTWRKPNYMFCIE